MRRAWAASTSMHPPCPAGAPGTLLDDVLTIACGDGAVRLTELQRAGKRPMSAVELLRGFSLPKGRVLT